MQKLIAWLLKRYTPFRVVAWAGGKIAGIGGPNPYLTLDSSRVDQINAQMWGAMGKGKPAEQIIEIDEEGKVHGDISGLRPSKPWPLDRRQRVR